jgi:SAM-dependent methyltransferase
MGREFTAPAWGKIGPDSVIELRRCQHCGFEFFDPSLAGNEIFYRELEHAEYFVENRPEFARTLDFARERGLKRILDVGCGSGIFLDLARAAGAETFGLELNRAAADKAQTKGHKVFNQLLGELPPDANGFDLITFFQVLEHVPEPVTLMREAAARLRPGGFIAVAVPSADGVFRLVPRDPHQWPPHHMSRWRLRDFQLLARTTGLELIESGGDNLLGSEINHFWNVHNQLAPAVGKPKRAGSPAIVSLLSFLYRKTGMKFLFPHWGSSIYACFKRTG